MQCPFCGKDMDEGIVSASFSRGFYRSRIFWEDKKDDRKPREKLFAKGKYLYAENYRGELLLENGTPLIPAHKCDDCQKVILDTYVTAV